MSISVNTSLSNGQARFVLMLEEKAPYLLHLWDFKDRSLKIDLFERYLSTASHGEQVMARFFAGIWLNKNQYNFDLFDATSVLNKEERLVIIEWISDPFWP